MGVTRAMIVGPSHHSSLPDDAFVSLVRELTSNHLLQPPFTVMQGELPPYPRPFSFWSKGVADYGNVRVTFQSDESHSLAHEISELLGRGTDFCVLFPGFDLSNQELAASFETLGFFNADVGLYSFRAPAPIEIQYFRFIEGDRFRGEDVLEEISLSQYFCSIAEGGPETVAATPLEPIFARHFGPDMKIYRSYF
jgi:hypothetical protein